ncbi:hypothetical protein HC031_20750 [Planosporangium thailandense]|uniref:ESX-1 secretion-associated protein n=1 Tax=Planosporangium thailandense TaxID=765197 RepID=A0ABX0Y1A1_9ACTN|nr:hypothetical protein [Planosporangium thailandense]
MGDGFQVTLRDLANAAGSFHDGADQFSCALGDVKGLRVDSGDGALNKTIHATLETLDALHVKVVQALHQTGNKLTEVHDNYQRTNLTARELFDSVMNVDPIDTKK